MIAATLNGWPLAAAMIGCAFALAAIMWAMAWHDVRDTEARYRCNDEETHD